MVGIPIILQCAFFELPIIFKVEQPCTSLSMSPTGDYLATTHIGELGVFLWANRLLYERVFLKPIDRNTVDIPRLSEYENNYK